ncbi:MAG: hypothetical protein R2751_14940 [Bacteroidales bacterium]
MSEVARIRELEADFGTGNRTVFYLSTPPPVRVLCRHASGVRPGRTTGPGGG